MVLKSYGFLSSEVLAVFDLEWENRSHSILEKNPEPKLYE